MQKKTKVDVSFPSCIHEDDAYTFLVILQHCQTPFFHHIRKAGLTFDIIYILADFL